MLVQPAAAVQSVAMASARTVHEALLALHGASAQPQQRAAASRYLEGFQREKEAWPLCVQLLAESGASLHARLYAAQTLRQKIHRMHPSQDLSPEKLVDLRTALFTALVRSSKTGPVDERRARA